MFNRRLKERVKELEKENNDLDEKRAKFRNQAEELRGENDSLRAQAEELDTALTTIRTNVKETLPIDRFQQEQDFEARKFELIQAHNQQLSEKWQEYESWKSKIRQAHQQEKHELQWALQSEKEQREQQFVDQRKRYESREITTSQLHQQKLHELQQKIQSTIDDYERRYNEQEKHYQIRLIKLEETHQHEQDELQQALESMKDALMQQLGDQRQHYQNHEIEIRRTHQHEQDELQQTIQSMTDRHERQLNDQKRYYESCEARIEQAHQKKQEELQQAIRLGNEKHKQQHDDQRKNYESREVRIEKAHQRKYEELQRAIQSRNNALIAREKTTPITDGEIKSLFSSLVGDVDDLAQFKWTFNRSPWTDQAQRQIDESPRRLQKQILQDTIWGTLFHSIFASPFRGLGDKGKELELKWNAAFGKGMAISLEFRLRSNISNLPTQIGPDLHCDRSRNGQRALHLAVAQFRRRTLAIRDLEAMSRSTGNRNLGIRSSNEAKRRLQLFRQGYRRETEKRSRDGDESRPEDNKGDSRSRKKGC